MIALYARVSTDEQAEHGFSIDSQKDRLEAYCKSQAWEDYRFYVDDGYTGTNTDRPALQLMLTHIKEGKIQTVVVFKLDRLSRKQKDVLQLLEDQFEKNKVAFKSVTEYFDTASPLGKVFLGILAAFAQFERDTIVERVTNAMVTRTKKGLWNGGPPPFGYRYDIELKKLLIHPEEAEIVREVFKKFIQGYSYGKISDSIINRLPNYQVNYAFVRRIATRAL